MSIDVPFYAPNMINTNTIAIDVINNAFISGGSII